MRIQLTVLLFVFAFSPCSFMCTAEEVSGHEFLWRGEFRSLGDWWRYQDVLETTADGKQWLIGSNGNHLVLYDLATGRVSRMLATREAMQDATLSPNGKLLAVAEWRDGFSLRDADSLKVLKTFSGSAGLGASAVRFTPDGNRLLCHSWWSGGTTRFSKHQLLVYDIRSDHLTNLAPYDLSESPESIVREKFARFGNDLYTIEYLRKGASRTGVRVWATHPLTGVASPKISLPREDCQHFGLSPDGRRAIIQQPGKPVRVIDMLSGKTIVLLENRTWASGGSFSPNGRFIATVRGAKHLGTDVARQRPDTRESNVVLHDATTGKELARLEHPGVHRDYYGVCFSRDSQYIISTTAESDLPQEIVRRREVILWGNLPDIPEKIEPLPTFDGVEPPEPSPRYSPGWLLPSGASVPPQFLGTSI